MSIWPFKRRRRPGLAAEILAVATRFRTDMGLTGPVDLDMPLGPEGLGFDSMGQMDFLSAVERECGVRIPQAYWGSRPLRNLNHLVDVCR